MRITVDTNILVSAAFWHGVSSEIIKRVEYGELELVLSGGIIEEFAGVLNYKEIRDKIKNKNLEMKLSVDKIMQISTIIEPRQKFDVVKEDPDDNKILECAKAGNVDLIISNDKHLLKLKNFEGIRIIAPSEFKKLLGQ